MTVFGLFIRTEAFALVEVKFPVHALKTYLVWPAMSGLAMLKLAVVPAMYQSSPTGEP